jgi:3-methyladenine DNA glycosylase AlkD
MPAEKLAKPTSNLTAEAFMEKLRNYQSDIELEKIQRYFKAENSTPDKFMGVRMGQVFEMAKAYINLPIGEIEVLLKSKIHEARVGAVSVMDFKARSKKITENERKALFDLYLNQHQHINNWDLVDRSAPHVIGAYLWNKDKEILYKLALSDNMWERRTAIVSTAFFIKHKQIEDTFKIAEMLVNDPEDLVQKAVGGWIREAGRKNKNKLISFLEKYAATMPRVMLRYAIEHLDPGERAYYLGMKNEVRSFGK